MLRFLSQGYSVVGLHGILGTYWFDSCYTHSLLRGATTEEEISFGRNTSGYVRLKTEAYFISNVRAPTVYAHFASARENLNLAVSHTVGINK